MRIVGLGCRLDCSSREADWGLKSHSAVATKMEEEDTKDGMSVAEEEDDDDDDEDEEEDEDAIRMRRLALDGGETG